MQINYTFHWPMKTENFDLKLARKLYSSPPEKGIFSLSGNKVGGCAVVEYDEMYFHKQIRENLFCVLLGTSVLSIVHWSFVWLDRSMRDETVSSEKPRAPRSASEKIDLIFK